MNGNAHVKNMTNKTGDSICTIGARVLKYDKLKKVASQLS